MEGVATYLSGRATLQMLSDDFPVEAMSLRDSYPLSNDFLRVSLAKFQALADLES